ncbi:hypothetical protein DFH06DRAFT_1428103 [Mycena polygramma]|nr:hypothetical protein DFH06DRAFT_1428103 [Mycena polygramma]
MIQRIYLRKSRRMSIWTECELTMRYEDVSGLASNRHSGGNGERRSTPDSSPAPGPLRRLHTKPPFSFGFERRIAQRMCHALGIDSRVPVANRDISSRIVFPLSFRWMIQAVQIQTARTDGNRCLEFNINGTTHVVTSRGVAVSAGPTEATPGVSLGLRIGMGMIRRAPQLGTSFLEFSQWRYKIRAQELASRKIGVGFALHLDGQWILRETASTPPCGVKCGLSAQKVEGKTVGVNAVRET